MKRCLTSTEISIAQYRDGILGGNLHNFDVEAAETIEAIKLRPDKELVLMQRIWKFSMLYRKFNQGSRPPKLLKLIDESSEDYTQRCYERFNK